MSKNSFDLNKMDAFNTIMETIKGTAESDEKAPESIDENEDPTIDGKDTGACSGNGDSDKYSELKRLAKAKLPSINTVGGVFFPPATRIDKALKVLAPDVPQEHVLGLIDTSLGNSGKTGYLFTTAGIYVKEILDKESSYIRYNEIEKVEISERKSKDCNRSLTIYFNDQRNCSWMHERTISDSFVNKTPFMDFLNEVIVFVKQGLTAGTDKYLILEDMPDAFKESYITAAIAFANADHEINGQELNRLYSLMVRIKTTPELRQKMIQEKLDMSDFPAALDQMEQHTDRLELKVIYTSLAKDILVLSGTSTNHFDAQQRSCLDELKRRSGLTDAAIKLIQNNIELERDYISGKINDTQFTDGMKKLASGASAVGVPIAALYLSGSVVGLSAAGITSGLAALGLGGVLGLSSMVTGVGILVLAGVGIYKGVKTVLNHGDTKKATQAEKLRKAAEAANQKMISALIEDMNYLTEKISDLLEQQAVNQAMMKRLAAQFAKLKDAFKTSTEQTGMVPTEE